MTFDARDIRQQQTIFSDPGQNKTTFFKGSGLSEGHMGWWKAGKINVFIDFYENVNLLTSILDMSFDFRPRASLTFAS